MSSTDHLPTAATVSAETENMALAGRPRHRITLSIRGHTMESKTPFRTQTALYQ